MMHGHFFVVVAHDDDDSVISFEDASTPLLYLVFNVDPTNPRHVCACAMPDVVVDLLVMYFARPAALLL